jgi:hypothetical protein
MGPGGDVVAGRGGRGMDGGHPDRDGQSCLVAQPGPPELACREEKSACLSQTKLARMCLGDTFTGI